MKIGQDFNQIGTIDNGELVIKLPGTDFVMPYENGRAFLSDSGIGYVSLPVRKMNFQRTGEPKGLMGALGRQIAEQLEEPSVQPRLREILAARDFSLFYSKAKEGTEILCLPGMAREDDVGEENVPFPGLLLAVYSMNGEVAPVERVYALHMKAIGKRELVIDRSILEKEVLQLVLKANGIYDRALQITNLESGF